MVLFDPARSADPPISVLLSLISELITDSVNLAFTSVSSGGFLPSENLSSILKNDLQIFVFSITLLIPIFNFFLFYDVFTRQFLFKNHYEDLHIGTLIALLTLFLYFFVIPEEGFANVVLAITSSISTSGLTTYSSFLDL